MTVSYQLGRDAAIVLKYGGVDQAVVKGLNKLGLPGLERSVVEIEEFRNDLSRQFAGGGKLGVLTYSGNLVTGDTKGQDQLKTYWLSGEKITDCRAYLNLVDFLTVDLANDSLSAFQVTKVSPGEADKNGVFPYTGEMCLNGRPAIFTAHQTATNIAIVAGSSAADTITGTGFVDAGFEAGQTLIIEGSAADDGQYLIASVTATLITLTTDTVTGETAGSSITLHGGRL